MSSNTIIGFRPRAVIRQLPWQLDSKTALGFLLILATFSLVGWLYLTQASAVAATSYRIDELRLELDQIKNQNAALILEIAELEALSRVEARALELGFRPTTDIRYLPVADYPLSTEAEESIYTIAQVESSVEAYSVETKEASWWVAQLDLITAWVVESGNR